MGRQEWEKQMALLLMHDLQDLQKVLKEISIFACVLEEQTIKMYPVRWQRK